MTTEQDWFVIVLQNLINEKLETIRVLNTLITELVRAREQEADLGKGFELNHEIMCHTDHMKRLRDAINLNREVINEHNKSIDRQ